MLLDVVHGEPQIRWLATERDKQVFFLTERNLEHEQLPSLVFKRGGLHTVHYFADKLPIGIGPEGQVTFIYLVTDADRRGVQRFMVDHLNLFRSMYRCTIRLVFPTFLAAGQKAHISTVESFFAPLLRPVVFDEFQWFCSARKAVEAVESGRGRRSPALH